ncbi:acyl-CoA thioesterase [Marivivens marinus]|uniref:acyl-CoA thioesterase n=1 Tax=Marivivens marinus TaxID=3110173 RepID=UPI003B845E91
MLFRHCDPAGIVFFPRYFEMINDCVEHFFAECLGWPFEEIHKVEAVPTAEISTRFVAPSRHGDRLRLTLTVTRVGRSSLGYRIEGTCDDAPRFTAEATLVYVDGSGKPTPWTQDIRDKLTKEAS